LVPLFVFVGCTSDPKVDGSSLATCESTIDEAAEASARGALLREHIGRLVVSELAAGGLDFDAEGALREVCAKLDGLTAEEILDRR
jgi:hypothetical protein